MVTHARDTKVGRERQHEEYGGTNWGAAFFGWLVAIGIAALLTALLSAAGTAISFSEVEQAAEGGTVDETLGLVGGILLIVIAVVAYYAGGYVAGRMSRFDGARQGFGVWVVSVAIAILLALAGVIAGEEYNLFAGLDLPRIPVDEGDLTTGALIVLAVVLIATALAAIAGGKAGQAYHRRVDAAGYGTVEERRDRVGRERDVGDDRGRGGVERPVEEPGQQTRRPSLRERLLRR